MLTAVVFKSEIHEVRECLLHLDPIITTVEWRLDALHHISLEEIKAVCQSTHIPMILTLRNSRDGGLFKKSETERQQLLFELSYCGCDYIDIEDHVPSLLINKISRLSQPPKIIRSYHNFEYTPDNLDSIYEKMFHESISFYKMVTTARSSLDGFRLLTFSKQHANLSAHCMGEKGLFTRILALACETPFIYASLDRQTHMEHMLTISDFIQYGINRVSSNPDLYALIGDPIRHSPGTRFHNQAFKEGQRNAIYLAITIQTHELTEFHQYTTNFNFCGLSITIPLKNAAAKFYSARKKAINTVSFKHQIRYANTDGHGAIRAIESKTSLSQANILIIGTGGTAAGLISALQEHSCNITVLTRNQKTANSKLSEFDITILEDLQSVDHIDIIISTTPPSAYNTGSLLETLKPFITPYTTVMDVNYRPVMTPLLTMAKESQATIISGMDMFYEQAHLQQSFWQHNFT